MARWWPWTLGLIGVLVGGCNEPVYFAGARTLMPAADPMVEGGGLVDTELFVVPVRMPTAAEMTTMVNDQARLALTQPVPWARAEDFDVELRWSITNLDARDVSVVLTLNGGNEFGDYLPELYVDLMAPPDEQVPPPALMGGTPVTLAANEVRSGVFREDQISESALDLEAIVRYPPADAGLATPFQVIEHRSNVSRIGLEAVPENDVIPAMVRFQLNISSSGPVSVDYSVRVRDHSGKLGRLTDMPLYVSTDPARPPVVMPMAAMTP